MQTNNLGAIVRLKRDGKHLSIHLLCNPGPFPFGIPSNLSKGQYIGTSKHLIMTLMEDKALTGLLAFQADVPRSPLGDEIRWVGGVMVQPWIDPRIEVPDLFYHISTLFIRDVDSLLSGCRELKLQALITGVNGVVSGRQYWMVEIPAITREVLLCVDELVIVRRHKEWEPQAHMPSRIARGPFWQMGLFAQHPIIYTGRGYRKG